MTPTFKELMIQQKGYRYEKHACDNKALSGRLDHYNNGL